MAQETEKNLIEEVNNHLRWLILKEHNSIVNQNDSVLNLIDEDILNYLVDHWYTCREKEIFMNKSGEEIDEYLNVIEYKFNDK